MDAALPIASGAVDYESSSASCSESTAEALLQTTWWDYAAEVLFQVASYLTEPVCQCRELFYRIQVVEYLNPEDWKISNVVRQAFLFMGLATCAALAVFATLPGIALRSLASRFQEHPYIYSVGDAAEKDLPDNHTFSLLAWNICGIYAGYCITDGGVVPLPYRIDAIINKIVEADADVVCLYEVFDVNSAYYISQKLKQEGYVHFFFNVGPKAFGVSSGTMVASKYHVKNPEFTPYSQDLLVGRTKNASKGIFSFDLQSQEKSFARVYALHLQHSEECVSPTEEEVESRKKQMEVVMKKIEAVKEDLCLVAAGDFNLDQNECDNSFWRKFFIGDDIKETWGGSILCSSLMDYKPCPPLKLDYVLVVKETAESITSTPIKTGYDAKKYTWEALSDHDGIRSEIKVVL
jgi:endonuclease/exonuclease/phosphatase family metal-dependent hydrolase